MKKGKSDMIFPFFSLTSITGSGRRNTMLLYRNYSLIIIIFFSTLIAGCAANPGIIKIQFPEPDQSVKKNNKNIFIQSVSDLRKFQADPQKIQLPSFTYDNPAVVSPERKKSTVGIKRNLSGLALDDIRFIAPQNVESIIKDTLEYSLTNKGYTFINDKKKIAKNTNIIEIEINQFWEYMQAESFTVIMKAIISADLQITNKKTGFSEQKTITVKSSKKYQIANRANWNDIIRRTLNKFIIQTNKILPGNK